MEKSSLKSSLKSTKASAHAPLTGTSMRTDTNTTAHSS